MKEKIFIFLMFYLVLNVAVLASISRFPIDSTSQWKIDHIRNGVSDEEKHISNDAIYSYYLKGDTIIGSHTYYRVFKAGVSYLDEPFYYERVYVGALRDEADKFYFVAKSKTSEELLYDFTSEVGDTIQVPYDGVFEEKIVSSIDSLPDGRKMIHFNPKEVMMGCGDQYIIEGIGGSGGLLEGPVCNHFWTFDNHLVCFTQNDLLIYHDNNFEYNCGLVKKPEHEVSLDSTCVWRVDKQVENDSMADFEKIDYFIRGDTLIGGNSYLKLFKDGFQLLIEPNGSFTSGINHSLYTGAIRESDNRFYFVGKGSQAENLLYDFNLKTGDVIAGIIDNGKTIVGVDSAIDNRKNLLLSEDTWQNFILEGIGSDKGLLESRDGNSSLVCFVKNDVPIYHNSTGAECILSFGEYNFYDCDKLKMIPEHPTDKDEIKLVARVCYQVASPDPIYPDWESEEKTAEENSIHIKLNYTYDDLNFSQPEQMMVPLFDTIQLGKFPVGDYSAEINVNTTHINSGDPYTVEYDRNLYLSFTVSATTDVTDPAASHTIHIYPSPATDFVFIELNNPENRIHAVDLYNLMGKKVEVVATNESSGKYRLDVSGLQRGIYLVVLRADDTVVTGKIILD